MSTHENDSTHENLLNQVAELTRENEKLKQTIADVYGVLNEVEETATSDQMFEVIDDACDYIISDLPEEFSYEEEGSNTIPDDDAQLTADETAALEQEMLKRLRKKMAEVLNTDEETLSKIKDPNIGIPALRQAMIRELTDEELSRIHTQYLEIANLSRKNLRKGLPDTGSPDFKR